jgi:hypothetical protein
MTTKEGRKSALRVALLDFVLMFVISVCWNFLRKSGTSVVDEFGVAFLTAVFVYAFYREA